ncbi:helix-turn-helix domain-containing protein [Bacillus sp. RAR_GA_16]|uniref:helix-turn-helix domain-containing protein n=1 Tax=Bacillus sp. RAR_GA_16 TaxID=2876774 RepID=UPI001CCCCFA9|nr:helix-turn-helix domain-containing protein [Bacillus sp. RAR_GA_16]MCA0174074.1 helix-turn-helix domain-containing protein [Bacillus sp. RAR_GA_16]
MAKYSDDFKLKVVMEYLQGSLGYTLLAKKYGMPDKSPIMGWVRAYQAFGKEGLRRKRSRQVFPVQFKLNVLHFMKQTGASHRETAIAFKMNNPSLIANWSRTLQKEGIGGLHEKAKGRPSMSKNHKNKSSKSEKELTREEQLERENELLRLENSYLKKLKAFQENPNAYLEKHKQRWYSNSKKKDSN